MTAAAIGVSCFLITCMLSACSVHGTDAPATLADSGTDAHTTDASQRPTSCPPTDAGICDDGLGCALYCDNGAAHLGCHAPSTTSAKLGEACEGIGCREGACIGGLADAPTTRCLPFCKSDSDCQGTKCQTVSVNINCGTGRANVSATLCR